MLNIKKLSKIIIVILTILIVINMVNAAQQTITIIIPGDLTVWGYNTDGSPITMPATTGQTPSATTGTTKICVGTTGSNGGTMRCDSSLPSSGWKEFSGNFTDCPIPKKCYEWKETQCTKSCVKQLDYTCSNGFKSNKCMAMSEEYKCCEGILTAKVASTNTEGCEVNGYSYPEGLRTCLDRGGQKRAFFCTRGALTEIFCKDNEEVTCRPGIAGTDGDIFVGCTTKSSGVGSVQCQNLGGAKCTNEYPKCDNKKQYSNPTDELRLGVCCNTMNECYTDSTSNIFLCEGIKKYSVTKMYAQPSDNELGHQVVKGAEQGSCITTPAAPQAKCANIAGNCKDKIFEQLLVNSCNYDNKGENTGITQCKRKAGSNDCEETCVVKTTPLAAITCPGSCKSTCDATTEEPYTTGNVACTGTNNKCCKTKTGTVCPTTITLQPEAGCTGCEIIPKTVTGKKVGDKVQIQITRTVGGQTKTTPPREIEITSCT